MSKLPDWAVARSKEILPKGSIHYPILESTWVDGSKHVIKAFYVDELEKLIAQALADEREACAKVADDLWYKKFPQSHFSRAAKRIATAIRGRQ